MPWSMSTYTRVFISENDKVARNEKQKKIHGFSYYKNIANFEAFWWDKNFSKNLLFLGSVVLILYCLKNGFSIPIDFKVSKSTLSSIVFFRDFLIIIMPPYF